MAETTFWVDVTFSSDWYIGTGEGRHGAINRSTLTDDDDLPYVPAKTMVGVLRDAAETAANALDGCSAGVFGQWVEAIFGTQRGERDPPIGRPRAAALRGAPLLLPAKERAYITRADTDGMRVLTAEDFTRAAKLLTTAVAIDPRSGAVAEDAVATMERARAGLTVCAEWSLRHPDNAERWPAELLLCAAAAITRHIGGKRRRGAGVATVSIRGLRNMSELRQRLADGVAPPPWRDPVTRRPTRVPRRYEQSALSHRHDLVLTVERPIVVDAAVVGNAIRTATSIPGSLLLPIVGAALENTDLAELIAEGAIIVTDATPQIGAARGLPWPRALMQPKDAGPNNRTYVNATAEHREDPRLAPRSSRFLSEDCRRWCEVDVVRRVHAVVDDEVQRVTRAMGGPFEYEGIAAGTALRANIFLADGVELDRSAIDGPLEIGRSVKDDYGRAAAELVDVTLRPASRGIPAGMEFRVWATSDLLLRGDRGRAVTDPRGWVRVLSDALGTTQGIDLAGASTRFGADSPFASVRETALVAVSRRQSWQRRWGLPRPSLIGIAAGSVVVCVCAESISPEAISRMQRNGIGERTAEGFGRVIVDPVALRSPSAKIVADHRAPSPASSTINATAADVGIHLMTAAWRSAIIGAAAVQAMSRWSEFTGSTPSAAQVSTMRRVVDEMTGVASLPTARAWINQLLSGRSATQWEPDPLRRLGELINHDPAAADHPIWPALFGRTPEDLVEDSADLAVFAVRRLLIEAVAAAVGRKSP